MTTTQAQATAELVRLDREYQELLTSLVDADWERPGTIGGGDWSLRDLVGHVMSWEELALGVISAAEADRPPPWPTGNIDEINREMVARQGRLPLEELRRRAARTHAQLIQVISELPLPTWGIPISMGDEPPVELNELVGRVLGAEDHPFGHLTAHLGDLRSFAEAPETS
ncbi:MAG: maleylpyruvate isomerase N-terminal domain-containing protein [Candidatus Dormiibacterota bacterium]